MTVLWSTKLPSNFKKFCAKTSIKTSAIQYENDDLMRVTHGDDYAIACCVSSMRIGKEMQFFGARANLAKCLLYAINGGVDERLKIQVGHKYRPVTGDYLDYDDVMAKYDDMMEWLAGLYVNTLNVIHYMHDKYSYERVQMALHDRDVKRYFATGIAGLSVVADSLSAIKYAKVKCIRDEDGIVTDYEVEGDFLSMATMTRELTRSQLTSLEHSWTRSESTTHTEMVFLQCLSLLSHLTLFMVRRLVLHLTEERSVCLLLLVLTQCTAEILTVHLHHFLQLLSCHSDTLRTVSQTHSLSFLTLLARTTRYSWATLISKA